MDNGSAWEDSIQRKLKIERSLNFTTLNEEEDSAFSRRKAIRDPMSHRVIEKRRRDRMNNCLADLSRLIPTAYIKKGRGRIEKTEIIEMAIRHLKHLQSHPCQDPNNCEVVQIQEQDRRRQFRLGYQECMTESVRYMADNLSTNGLCLRLVNHLQKHLDKVLGLNSPSGSNDLLCFSTSEDTKMDQDPLQYQSSYPNTPVSLNGCHFTEEPENKFMRDPIQIVADPPKSQVIILEENGAVPSPAIVGNPAKRPCLAVNNEGSSQLREMLQNPGITKETRNGTFVCQANISPKRSQNSTPELCLTNGKLEEVYNFKKNIKHRFNADLQHNNQSLSPPPPSITNHVAENKIEKCEITPSLPIERFSSERNGSKFMPYQNQVAELSVKIPTELPGPTKWESHTDYGSSSCGSNSSASSVVPRSNGSSSGYSTGGEAPNSSKLRFHLQSCHSPPPNTPENLSSPSTSPHQITTAVPIFALHPKGTYYIPLCIDTALISPLFNGFEDPYPVLHPVNISVNFSFGRPVKLLERSHINNVWPGHAVDKIDRCVYVERNGASFETTTPVR